MKLKVHFNLRFSSRYGQNLRIVGDLPELGNGSVKESVQMNYINQKLWHCTIEIEVKKRLTLKYAYVIEENGSFEKEWEKDRFLELKKTNISVFDIWNAADTLENTYLTAPFQNVFFRKKYKTRIVSRRKSTHVFRVKAPLLKEDEILCLIGNCKALNNWNTEKKPLELHPVGNWLSTQVDLSNADFPIAYKYGVWNTTQNQFVSYEHGENRVIQSSIQMTLSVLHDGFANLKYEPWKAAGVAVPIFSLRSENGLGVGEFTDISALANWAISVGMKLLQFLPINDTSATDTWTDSYPYASISAFALHPQYLNIEAMAGAKHKGLLKLVLKEKKRLNALEVVDYESVMDLKWKAIKMVYKKEAPNFRKEAEYNHFYDSNASWLLPYAAFCVFKNKYGTADFQKWKTNSIYDKAEIEALNRPKNKAFEDMGLHLFVQYHLHLQLKAAVDYCHHMGLAVKGDIPIGIYRYSADAWTAPDLYNMNQQAGAPPDAFAVSGQNWGFPTYNWERMKTDDFVWWRQRFDQMSNYFDAFRIDHILGFFRIWSIPMHAIQGILGRFVPAIPVRIHEFYSSGLGFAYDRYCKPFITDDILQNLFENQAEYVAETFLEKNYDGTYKFKSAFDTQKKVEAYFEDIKTDESTINGLFTLLANIILIEEDESEGQSFHFRINIEQTSSFQQLEAHAKARLLSLYNDYFFKRQEDLWKNEAMEKLPSLKAATEMLICGEDLGMVPDCVPDVMKDLAILSLEIQRMPKQTGIHFSHSKNAPYLSVVTPSTHDMSPLRLWWEEEELIELFYRIELDQSDTAPKEITPGIAQSIIAQHLWSPAMFSIFQFQDIFAMDKSLWILDKETEQINVPANPKHYWRYRMPLTLEELQSKNTFNELLYGMIHQAGRS